MDIYQVGGAVRDAMLGLPVTDRDYVVVGATVDAMLAQGFQPVGRDFPVFLHPQTHDEYALARTERKTAPGYTGFVVHADPSVSLEQDLLRRDFTVNAMARAADGSLVDPWGGQADLQARVFRHVSPAFTEDPLRILRGARFLARFTDFRLADETLQLMREMVQAGEVDHLVPERVWQEIARGLMAERPSRMLSVLRDCGALARIAPEIDRLFGVRQNPCHHPEIDAGWHTLLVVDQAARAGASLEVRFAALTHDLGKAVSEPPDHTGHELLGDAPLRSLCERLKVPAVCRDLARLTVRWHGEMHAVSRLSAEDKVRLLENLDAFRRPERLEGVLAAGLADVRGRPGHETDAYPQAVCWRNALRLAMSVDAGGVAKRFSGQDIANRIHVARVAAVSAG